jgi:hypothetical protein
MRHVRTLVASSLALLLATACGAPEASPGAPEATVASTEEALATTYLDMQDFASSSQTEQDRYFAMTRALKAGFDDVCGDTFCEGDYSNLESLGFRCAVTSKTGKIKSCLWTFAGSYELVDAKTGKINVSARTFTCAIPAVGTTKSLLDALAGDGPTPAIRRTLPGSTRTAYDALVGCLP